MKKSAFTLIELLVVIFILAIFVTIGGTIFHAIVPRDNNQDSGSHSAPGEYRDR